MSGGKRGQSSTEFIMIIGVILVLLIPLFWYAWSRTNVEVKENKAVDCVQALAAGADEVFSLSPGSKKYIVCNVPGSVLSWGVDNNEINMKLSTSGDHVAFTQGDVIEGKDALGNPTLPKEQGTYRIPVELTDQGIVKIGEGSSGFAGPPSITWTWPSGDTCNPVVLRVNTDQPTTCKYKKKASPTESNPGWAGILTDPTSCPTVQDCGSMEGKSSSHFISLGALPTDVNYDYWVACQDDELLTTDGDVLPPTSPITFRVEFADCGGSTAPIGFEENRPVVTLTSPGTVHPPEGPSLAQNTQTFTYQVDDESNVLFCELLIDDVNDNVGFTSKGLQSRSQFNPSTTIPKNTPLTMQATLDRSLYNWTVNCTDSWGTVGEGAFPPQPQPPNYEPKRYLNFRITTPFDMLGPTVTQVSPTNGDWTQYPSTTFIYRANDATSGVKSCIVNITQYPMKLGQSNPTTLPKAPIADPSTECDSLANFPTTMPNMRLIDGEIVEGADESVGAWLDRGCYLWNVYCYDDSPQQNRGQSADDTGPYYGRWYYQYTTLQTFNAAGNGAGMSCNTYCLMHGYLGSVCGNPSLCAGDCDSAPAQCKKQGGVWGGAESDLFCQVLDDPASDTCCCYP